MKKNGKWFRELSLLGKYEIIPCKPHSFTWSGNMPCTGIQYCPLCGKTKKIKKVLDKTN